MIYAEIYVKIHTALLRPRTADYYNGRRFIMIIIIARGGRPVIFPENLIRN